MEETKSSYFKFGMAVGDSEHANSVYMIKALTSPGFDQEVKSYIMYCFDVERKNGNVPETIYQIMLTMTGLKHTQLTSEKAAILEQDPEFVKKLQEFMKKVVNLRKNVDE